MKSPPLMFMTTSSFSNSWIGGLMDCCVLLLDWMPRFDLTWCPWSFNNSWYVNNRSAYSSSILHLLFCLSELHGEGDSGKDCGRRDKKPFISAPIRTRVAECLLSYHQATPQSHTALCDWRQCQSDQNQTLIVDKGCTQLHQVKFLWPALTQPDNAVKKERKKKKDVKIEQRECERSKEACIKAPRRKWWVLQFYHFSCYQLAVLLTVWSARTGNGNVWQNHLVNLQT